MFINFHLDFDDGLIFILLIIFVEPRWFRPLGTMNGWLRWCGSMTAAVPQIISHDHSLFSLGPRLVVELVLQWWAVGICKDPPICHLFHLVIVELLGDKILFGQDLQGIHKMFVDDIHLLLLDSIKTRPRNGWSWRTGTSLVTRFSAQVWWRRDCRGRCSRSLSGCCGLGGPVVSACPEEQ